MNEGIFTTKESTTKYRHQTSVFNSIYLMMTTFLHALWSMMKKYRTISSFCRNSMCRKHFTAKTFFSKKISLIPINAREWIKICWNIFKVWMEIILKRFMLVLNIYRNNRLYAIVENCCFSQIHNLGRVFEKCWTKVTVWLVLSLNSLICWEHALEKI